MTTWLVDNDAELIDRLDEVATSLGDDAEDVLHIIARLRAIKTSLTSALASQEARLCELLGDDTLTVPGVARVTRVPQFKSQTHGSKLAATVAAQVADLPANEDGEPFPPAVLCARTADAVVEVFGLDTASTSFRMTAVKARGLKPGQFRDSERVGWRVSWEDA